MPNVVARISSVESSFEQFSPLQPDTMLPVQYYADRGEHLEEPTKRLMHAILADAIRCFQTYADVKHGPRRQEFAEARYWLFFEGGNGPFSFLNICEVLSIDPRSIRRSLTRWRDRHKSAGEQSAALRSPVAQPVAARTHRKKTKTAARALPISTRMVAERRQ